MGLRVGYNWGYKSPKWGYPNYNLLITLLTKSPEPSSTGDHEGGEEKSRRGGGGLRHSSKLREQGPEEKGSLK